MFRYFQLNKQTPFWILCFSVCIGLTLPLLVQDGMFMDSILYTSVAHNLSNDIGTLWFPKFDYHGIFGLNTFHEQPPLVFAIQSIFFKLLGSSMYIERLYTFLCLIISIFLINKLWLSIFEDKPLIKKMGWIPIFLWISVPVCFWSFSNNMHENTMGIFNLLSILLFYNAFKEKRFRYIRIIGGAIFVVLASLSKGFPGFFPVVAPGLFWISTKKINIKQVIIYSTIIVGIITISFVILFSVPQSKESLSIYLFDRVFGRINDMPVVSNRFYILFRLLTELGFQIALTIIILIISRVKKIENHLKANIREAVFFIGLGLSASVPLMLTLVQKAFYFVPSLPFFALGLGILVAPTVQTIINRIQLRTKKYYSLLILSIVFIVISIGYSISKVGKTSRDHEILHDTYILGEAIPDHSLVSSFDGCLNWSFKCYMTRYFFISFERSFKQEYCISLKQPEYSIPSNYEKVDLDTEVYDLYKRTDE